MAWISTIAAKVPKVPEVPEVLKNKGIKTGQFTLLLWNAGDTGDFAQALNTPDLLLQK
jgi:hypothetical protein